jgi:hypothetical protein
MKKITLPILMMFVITACLPTQATQTSVPLPVIEATPLPATETPAPITQTESTPVQTSSSAWKEVRDVRYGFGLAVPCWWLVSPIPAQGFGGVMTIANYDEAYFMANSQKGFWDWPNGTLKLDIVVMEDINPSLSDADAYMSLVDTSMQGLSAAEAQQTGEHTATVLTFTNLINANDPPVKVFVYRLAPDKLLSVNPIPQRIIDTPDFQAILSSIALNPQEQVVPPSNPPLEIPLINAACAQ